MQLSTNEFTYDWKEGKGGWIYRGAFLFATINSSESATQAITDFLNDKLRQQRERHESLEQQTANRLHNDKIINRATGEPY